MLPTTVKRMPSMRIVSPTAGRPAKSFLRSCEPRNATRRRSTKSSGLSQRPSLGTSLRISPYTGSTPRTAVFAMRSP